MKIYGPCHPTAILAATLLSLSARQIHGFTFTHPRLPSTPRSPPLSNGPARRGHLTLAAVSTPVEEGFPAAATSVRFFNATDGDGGGDMPRCIESKLLRRAYPAILGHIEEYGNPNIPLGSKEGNYCRMLRRAAFQQTLSTDEIDLLTDLGFRWNSFEGVYEEANFDDCLDRLLRYEEEVKSNYQIPKKYHPDPELGAWVTVIRRIGRENIEPHRQAKLDAINFAWKSTRKCGSSFMGAYKSLKTRLESCCRRTDGAADDDETAWELVDRSAMEEILREDDVRSWLGKQREAQRTGELSGSRCTYMDQLPGFDWRRWEE